MKTNRPRFALARGGVLCAVAALLVLGACEAKIPTAAEISAMDVAGAQKSAASSGLFSDTRFENADFFVDGLYVTRHDALAIEGSKIGSIEVVKGGRDTVFVTTVDRMPIGESLPRKRQVQTVGVATLPLPSLRTPGDGPNKTPTIVIDGLVSTEAALAAIPESEIASINVVKPTADGRDSRHPNGLLDITTKALASRGARAADRIAKREKLSESSSPAMLKLDGRTAEPRFLQAAGTDNGKVSVTWGRGPAPAFTIDGVPATKREVDRLDNVTGFDVVVAEKAVAISTDPAAANGLVRVTTDKAKKN